MGYPRTTAWRQIVLAAVAATGLLALSACDKMKKGDEIITTDRGIEYRSEAESRQSVFGEGGLFLGGKAKETDGGSGGIGVNSFLWRASLDTVSFMPISSADPFGGVIITDWHSPPQAPYERFKINVYILGRALRADGLRLTAFRQIRNRAGSWVEQPIDPGVTTNLENTILLRARQLRSETIQ